MSIIIGAIWITTIATLLTVLLLPSPKSKPKPTAEQELSRAFARYVEEQKG